MVIKRLKGMLDLLPEDSQVLDYLIKDFERVVRLYGFLIIRTPILELAELYYRSTGASSDIVNKEMYTFYDKKGRFLALRPEGTPGVLRAIIENALTPPIRLYYIGPMFRYERPQKGRLREHYQLGLEIIGEKSPYADFELINIASHFFSRINLKNTLTKINSIGCENCRPHFKAVFLEYLKDKDTLLCPNCLERKEKNPLRIFDCKNGSCQKVIKDSPKVKDFLCLNCENHFQEFLSYLKKSNLKYLIDENLVRGLDYYTKTTFEFICEDLSIGGGGRYDNLMKELGSRDTPCVGLGLGLERIFYCLKEEKKLTKYIMIVYEESFSEGEKLAALLRKEDIPCYLNPDLESLKKQLKLANKLNIRYVIIIKKGNYLLKDMASGAQEEIKKEEIIKKLKKVLSGVGVPFDFLI